MPEVPPPVVRALMSASVIEGTSQALRSSFAATVETQSMSLSWVMMQNPSGLK